MNEQGLDRSNQHCAIHEDRRPHLSDTRPHDRLGAAYPTVEQLTDRLMALVNQHPVKPGRWMQVREAVEALQLAVYGHNGDGHAHAENRESAA